MKNLAVALLVLLALPAACGGGGTDTPQALPKLRFADVRDGHPPVDLGALGGRPAVINVLAAWCAPCEKELPEFVAVERDVGDRVTFIGIDRQDSRRKATELLAKAGVSYPVGYDPDDTLFPRLRAIGMPTTLLVDGEGNIVAKHSGQLSGAELRRLIKEHFDVS